MEVKAPRTLATRLFVAQVIVIAVASLALLVTIILVAPGLFVYHLDMTGEDSPAVQQHAQEAFEISVGIALLSAGTVAVLTAVFLSWLLARRVSRPIRDLAQAAESVARGDYDISVPAGAYARELTTLANSFQRMTDDLASTDDARARLLADLAHEIRTPLATLGAHIDGLEDGLLPADAHNYDVMRGQVHRLQRLATDVKLVAAAEEHALDLHPVRTRITVIVQAACDLFQARFADKGVDLRNECHRDDAHVMVDPDRMQQLFVNLLDNALRHTPAGGLVTVTCAHRSGSVVVEVRDTGSGIPEEHLEQVFTRFHRVDDARSAAAGSGLGLTIAKAICRGHGATISASSRGPGLGTVISIRLPGVS